MKKSGMLFLALFGMQLLIFSCGDQEETQQPIPQNYSYNNSYPYNSSYYQPYPQYPYPTNSNPYPQYPYPTNSYPQTPSGTYDCSTLLRMVNHAATYTECSHWAVTAISQNCIAWAMDPCQNKR